MSVSQGDELNFCLRNQDWSTIKSDQKVDRMSEKCHEILNIHLRVCFVWKRMRRKSNASPWVTDGLQRQIKTRLAVFRQEGRSQRWKMLDTTIKDPRNPKESTSKKKQTD